MFQPEKNQFEFFKDFKKETPSKNASVFIVMWGMFLFTFYKLLSSFSRMNKKVAFFLFFSVALATYFYYDIENKKQVQINNITLTAGRAEFIKSFDPSRVSMIEAYILTIKEAEKKKIVDMYWTAQYIMTEENTSLNNYSLNNDVNQQLQAVNLYYSSLSKDINMAYSLVKADKSLLVPINSSFGNPLENLIQWDSKAKSGSITFLPDTNDFIVKWSRYLKDPIKLAAYMEKNKNVISKSTINN